LNLNNLRGRKDGNSWSSGLAPPPPPGTPPARKANPNRNSGGNNSPSDGSAGGGSNKSGIGAGGIAGIVISIFVVGAIVAFFLMKRRSRRSSSDIEKFDNQPFAPLVSNEVQGKVRICILQFYIFFPFLLYKSASYISVEHHLKFTPIICFILQFMLLH
jgi:hypothetical protein